MYSLIIEYDDIKTTLKLSKTDRGSILFEYSISIRSEIALFGARIWETSPPIAMPKLVHRKKLVELFLRVSPETKAVLTANAGDRRTSVYARELLTEWASNQKTPAA